MGKLLNSYAMPHPPIIVPWIGKGEEGKAQSTVDACKKVSLEIKGSKPDTIIFITPHGPLFRDAIAVSDEEKINGSFKDFGAPGIRFAKEINTELTKRVINEANKKGITTVSINKKTSELYNIEFTLDHGAMVPMYFIDENYKDYKIMHITYGLLCKSQLYEFGMIIKKCIEEMNINAVIISSGDMSHKLSDDGPYSYSPYGGVYDSSLVESIRNKNILGIFNLDENVVKNAGECGLRSLYILLGALDGANYNSEVLSYEGPFGVGYGVFKFAIESGEGEKLLNKIKAGEQEKLQNRRKKEDIYITLARESLEMYIRKGEYINIPDYVTEEMLKEKHGAFVSLKKFGELRGCIGTINPCRENVAKEIIFNAVEAGVNDPRFYAVNESELDDLEYSVDILMPAERAEFEDLDPKEYGVIVKSGYKTGLLLPDLEGVDTKEEQVKIALKKAGISKNEKFTIERFKVIRHR